jgi:hypothetical protein
MKRILKYTLDIIDHQELTLPENSKILSVENQRDSIVLYALTGEELTTCTYSIIIQGTGYPADDVVGAQFIGTVSLYNSLWVFHVFARRIS